MVIAKSAMSLSQLLDLWLNPKQSSA